MTARPDAGVQRSLHLNSGTSWDRLDDAVWAAAHALDAFIEHAAVHQDLWRTTRRMARVAEADIQRAAAIAEPVRLLVLVEDWCGDAIYTIPVVARLVEANPLLSLRVVRRDLYEQLMDHHLTGESRSIPVVIAYDARQQERGWWGPRPSPLQEWVIRDGLELDAPARYKAIRTWYARDRGDTTVQECLQLLHHATGERNAHASG